jgi:signal transduction histidine kinase
MAEAEVKSWSLARRLTVWIAASVLALLGMQAVVAFWVVKVTLTRELDALVVEELAELRAGVLSAGLDPKQLEQILANLNHEHPEISLNIRIAVEPFDTIWFEGNSFQSAAGGWPEESELGVLGDWGFDKRAESETFRLHVQDGVHDKTGLLVRTEVRIDGALRRQHLERTASFFLLIAGLGGLATILVGVIFTRRFAGLLADVAQSAKVEGTHPSGEIQIPVRAPEEIHQVVNAFQMTIDLIRNSHSRNVLLTAGLAHELRSPLQNLISEAEVSLLRDRTGDDYRRVLRGQLEELRAFALVVDNLITLTALRDTKILPRGERFDLGEELRMRLDYEETEAQKRGVHIALSVKGDTLIYADREALVLMVRNLVGNAVRWTRDGTEVRLALEGTDDAISITVEDQGPGIRPEEREAIFEAFYMGKAPKKTRVGYGLGLALARTAARSAGGDIYVDNHAGGGARFVVRLPRRAPAEEPAT